jgi:hypothetical protein
VRHTYTKARKAVPIKLERMWKHILERELDQGVPREDAVRIASATVNKYRAKRARGGDGPRLVTRGGSRRQWYPGKASAGLGQEHLVCLEHNKTFATKAALASHYRSHGK